MTELAGTRVLVTGGSRGIGLATVRVLLARGAQVATCARDAARLDAALAALAPASPSAGEVFGLAADVSQPEQVEYFVRSALERFGAIDALVNNAGVVWAGAYAEQPFASLARIIDVNLKGTMYATRAVLPHMLARGRGTLVNIASGAGLSGFADVVAYSASKFGVVGFTEALNDEVRGRGIRVYGLCPGRVATDMQVQYSGARVGIAPEQVAQRIAALIGGRTRTPAGRCMTL